MTDENQMSKGNERSDLHNEILPLLTIESKGASEKLTPLEKESARFNAFLKEIYDFEAKLKDIANKKDNEIAFFNAKCLPELILLAETKLQFLIRAERIYASKPKKSKQYIADFCEFVGAFSEDVMQYNSRLFELHKKYLTIQVQQLNKKEKEYFKQDLFNGKEIFDDIDIDKSDFMDEAKTRYEGFTNENKIEEKLQQKNNTDLTSISINELYKALAKSLHPDLEKDEVIRAVKVNLMQELSEAKNNKDLFAMFRIQQKASNYLKKDTTLNIFSIDKLKSFNKALKMKVEQYKKEFNDAIALGYFRDRNGFLQKKTNANMEKIIKQQANTIKKVNKAIKTDLQFIRDADDLEEFIDTFLYYQDY